MNKYTNKNKKSKTKSNGAQKPRSALSQLKVLDDFEKQVFPQWNAKINKIAFQNAQFEANRKKDVEFNTMLMISLNGIAESLTKKCEFIDYMNMLLKENAELKKTVYVLKSMLITQGVVSQEKFDEEMKAVDGIDPEKDEVKCLLSMREIFEGRERAIKEFEEERARDKMNQGIISKIDVQKCLQAKADNMCKNPNEHSVDCLMFKEGTCLVVEEARTLYNSEKEEKEKAEASKDQNVEAAV